jgi:hypothetical protein
MNSIAQLVPQRLQRGEITFPECCRILDFYANDASAPIFEYKVDLISTMRPIAA